MARKVSPLEALQDINARLEGPDEGLIAAIAGICDAALESAAEPAKPEPDPALAARLAELRDRVGTARDGLHTLKGDIEDLLSVVEDGHDYLVEAHENLTSAGDRLSETV